MLRSIANHYQFFVNKMCSKLERIYTYTEYCVRGSLELPAGGTWCQVRAQPSSPGLLCLTWRRPLLLLRILWRLLSHVKANSSLQLLGLGLTSIICTNHSDYFRRPPRHVPVVVTDCVSDRLMTDNYLL